MVKVRVKRTSQRLRYSLVPQALKDLDQWVVWRLVNRSGKPSKPLYNVHTGRYAKTIDPLTWCSYQEAVTDLESGKYDGIGFVFTASDKLAGIDIDDCRNPETGEITAYAQGIIDNHPTYWEVSPSGTGVKGFLKTSVPVKSKRAKTNGVEVEIYCSDRYFTVTGNRLPNTPTLVKDCTNAFKQLHQTLSQETNKAVHSQGWIERERDPLTDDEILERLFSEKERGAEWEALYETGDWSKVKSDSEADAALLYKLAYYAGPDGHTQIERLARGSTLARMKWDSKRNDTTWLREQIIRACDHRRGETGSQQSGWKNTSTSTSFNSSTINAEWPEPLSRAAYYGLVGEFVDAVEPHTESDPNAILIQTLIACGNLIGRTAFFTVEANQHYCNEFACVIGQSSRGRKGTSWGYTQKLLENYDPGWVKDRIADGLSTGEGLIYAVRDVRDNSSADKLNESSHDVDVLDKRLMVIEPEFARVLAAIKRENSSLSAVVRSAWDSGNLRTMTRQTPMRASGAHISLITHITLEELRRCLSDTQIFNGFANRFMWVCARRSKFLPDGGNLDWTTLNALHRKLAQALKFAKKGGEVHRDKSAKQLWGEQYESLTQEYSGMFGNATSRGEAHVLRVSMTYALLDHSLTINAEHHRAAMEVWRYCRDSAEYVFGGKSTNPKCDRILKALREHPEGVSRTDLSSTVFSKNVKAVEIDSALEALLNEQTVRKDVKKGGGRPTELWFAV